MRPAGIYLVSNLSVRKLNKACKTTKIVLLVGTGVRLSPTPPSGIYLIFAPCRINREIVKPMVCFKIRWRLNTFGYVELL